jgi:hypothetical protein
MPYKEKSLGVRHQKILDFIADYQKNYGHPPSIREIGEACNISSTSVVNYYLDQLEKSGNIERDRKVSRGVRLEIPKSRMLRVFICHSSTDKLIAHRIYQQLTNDGFDAWLDKEKILPGENWELEIRNAIYDADVIIICLSKTSISKEGYVQKEIKYALEKSSEKPEGTIFIIPAKIEECDVPNELHKWQWVDLFEDDGYNKLIVSLKKRSKDLV